MECKSELVLLYISCVSDAVPMKGSVYGAGNGSIVLDYFRCNGNELQLMDCSHKPPQPYQCNSNNIASVLCQREFPILVDTIPAGTYM